MSIGVPAERPQRARKPKPSAAAGRQRLRLWLRMLRASRGIETELRERLRKQFGLTLPQFDVLAALARSDRGVNMTELSRYLMVSNGNVTGIVDRLVDDGLVERTPTPGDRRATRVRLTAKGHAFFSAAASIHQSWIDGILDCYDGAQVDHLIGQLDRVVARVRKPIPAAARNPGGKP